MCCKNGGTFWVASSSSALRSLNTDSSAARGKEYTCSHAVSLKIHMPYLHTCNKRRIHSSSEIAHRYNNTTLCLWQHSHICNGDPRPNICNNFILNWHQRVQNPTTYVYLRAHYTYSPQSLLTKVVAIPVFPHRPVLPIRCTENSSLKWVSL